MSSDATYSKTSNCKGIMLFVMFFTITLSYLVSTPDDDMMLLVYEISVLIPPNPKPRVSTSVNLKYIGYNPSLITALYLIISVSLFFSMNFKYSKSSLGMNTQSIGSPKRSFPSSVNITDWLVAPITTYREMFAQLVNRF